VVVVVVLVDDCSRLLSAACALAGMLTQKERASKNIVLVNKLGNERMNLLQRGFAQT
jgi:hypothetical protein